MSGGARAAAALALSAGLLLAAAPAPGAPSRRALVRSIDVGDAAARDVVRVGGDVCAASRRRVRLRCFSLASGTARFDVGDARAEQRTTRYRKWKSLGAWLARGRKHVVVQAYGLGRALLVRWVDARSGHVDRRVVVDDCGGPPRVVALSRDAREALVVWRRGFGRGGGVSYVSLFGKHGRAHALSLPAGKTLGRARLVGGLGDVPTLQRGRLLYVCANNRSRLYALDACTLRVRFTFARRGDPYPSLVGSRALLVGADGNARYLLDRQSGKLLSRPAASATPQVDSRAFFVDRGGALCFLYTDRIDCYR